MKTNKEITKMPDLSALLIQILETHGDTIYLDKENLVSLILNLSKYDKECLSPYIDAILNFDLTIKIYNYKAGKDIDLYDDLFLDLNTIEQKYRENYNVSSEFSWSMVNTFFNPLIRNSTTQYLRNDDLIENDVRYSSDGKRLVYYHSSDISFKIKDGTEVICDSALKLAKDPRYLKIPESVRLIGRDAFQVFKYLMKAESVGLKHISVSPLNKHYKVVDNVLFTSDMKELIYSCPSSYKTSYAVPDSVITIHDGAFQKHLELKQIIIPDSVTNIGVKVFFMSLNLSRVEFLGKKPKYVFEDNAIYTSDYKELVTLLPSESNKYYTIPKSVTLIRDYAFIFCYGIQRIEVPNSVVSIGQEAFSNCVALRDIVLPDSVTYIGDFAFTYCREIQRIEVPDSVVSLGQGAFSNCFALRDVVLPDSMTHIGDYTFRFCNLLTIKLPANLKTIGDFAFSYCEKLQYIDIPDSVTHIGDFAFSCCTRLSNINLSSSLEWIGDAAFEQIEELHSMRIPDSVKEMGNEVFYWNRIRYLTLSSSLTKIGSETFNNCHDIKALVIPDSVTEIEPRAFQEFESMYSIIISNSVSIIHEETFKNNQKLIHVDIPFSVKEIKRHAFVDCISLESVRIPKHATVDEHAFDGCHSLKDIIYY